MSMIQRGVQFRGVVNDLRRCTNAIRFVCYFFFFTDGCLLDINRLSSRKRLGGGNFFCFTTGERCQIIPK